MSDDERATATTREHAAFLRGHAYGVEQTINAHDGLIVVMPLALLCIRAALSERLADEQDERVAACMAEVRRVREVGAIDSLSVFEIEQAMR